ncbi:hypothetical protein ABZ626_18405 [Streptomyces longispororuber]|uniref:Uncharacterized protein n=1 Tax=Streptomyces longispororuber TaxID=68230 RepID=A0A919DWA3_9ACTN|nr:MULTISPECIES: hypothetical protein [Streptomyces]GHE84376.1 hypothetical protein GCM10018785_60460 [Streptomyces longispororuber]
MRAETLQTTGITLDEEAVCLVVAQPEAPLSDPPIPMGAGEGSGALALGLGLLLSPKEPKEPKETKRR